jgi:uncharacterized protein YjbI with pentapeptide repeats
VKINEFEKWVYGNDNLSTELEYDDYLSLIEFDYNSNDVYYKMDLILTDILERYLIIRSDVVKQTGITGICISNTGRYNYFENDSSFEITVGKQYSIISIDIQTILNVIKRCMSSYNIGEDNYLNLRETYLWKVNFICANLNKVDLSDAYLVEAILLKTNFENAKLNGANLTASSLIYAKLKGAELKLAQLVGANFAAADLKEVNLFSADLKGATFENANLEGAILFGAKNLTVDQLSKAKTLYNAKLDPELEEELRAKGFGHLLDYEP